MRERGRKEGPHDTAEQGALARTLVLVCVIGLFAWAAGAADAAALPSVLWQAPEDGVAGESAGQLGNPSALAVNPNTGHIYVAEQQNFRVSEFDVWGQFVRAWGWGVLDGSPEFQICTAATGCQAGIKGAGPGQLDRTITGGGIAVGPGGSIYVADLTNFRIEKFDSSGHFLLAFGEKGSKPGQFEFGQYGPNLAVASDGTVYVGETGQVQAFTPTGAFKAAIPFEGELEALEGDTVYSLAVDESGNLYITSPQAEGIFKVSPLGQPVPPKLFQLDNPRNLAVGTSGNVYTTEEFKEVVEFGPTGTQLISPGTNFADVGLSLTGLASSSACGIEGADLYVAASNGENAGFVTAYGPPPDPAKCPPPARPPTVSRQFAVAVSPESAQVKAEINPHFWPETTYYVEYGPGRCSEGQCPLRQPVAEKLLTEQVTNTQVATQTIGLPGLQPGTTYHFRFVAKSGGGGPVFGIDPDGAGPLGATAGQGLEGSFTTFANPSPKGPDLCSNAQFRTGSSAILPDCRAYEMVSPVDKSGGEIVTLRASLNDKAALFQATPSGDALTYSSYQAFGDAVGAPATSQYIARRQEGAGWASTDISPPRGTPHQLALATLESQYRVFSDDLCTGWLVHDTDPPLAPNAVESFPNLYKTDLCGPTQSYEALTTTKPPGQTPGEFYINVQGISADGSHTVFRAPGKLTAKAAPGTNEQCYESFEGALRLVSVLPNGTPNPTNCSVGISYTTFSPHASHLTNAVSQDGSKIFWTASSGRFGAGKIYLRINGENPTVAVSGEGEALSAAGSGVSQYWTASADGAKALYSVGKMRGGKADAYEFTAAGDETNLIAHEVMGFLGASKDASRVYFASKEVLSGANDEGASPVAGAPNLYLYEAPSSTYRFIGELSEADAQSESFIGHSPLATESNNHTAYVTPDGSVAVFMATAPLTGFDNRDVSGRKADAEVFRYDSAADGGLGELECISCNPTGIAPSGHELTRGEVSLEITAAAQVPVAEMPPHNPHVISDDGRRVLFESFEALVPGDTNEKEDVYQWEASGTGDCSKESSAYSVPNGGCLSLISSGQSPQDSEFIDASADGRDIFFTTASSLLVQDPGMIDLYDAREGGGFPPPPQPVPACQGESCQALGSAPPDVTPASSSYRGPGNAKRKAGKCARKAQSHRHGRAHCGKRHTHGKQKQKRRAGR